MTISDLIEERGEGIFRDAILKCELIALDSQDGKILFNTRKNKREYISNFLSGTVTSIWADARRVEIGGYLCSFKPVMTCYVLHNSWVKAENEDTKEEDDEDSN